MDVQGLSSVLSVAPKAASKENNDSPSQHQVLWCWRVACGVLGTGYREIRTCLPCSAQCRQHSLLSHLLQTLQFALMILLGSLDFRQGWKSEQLASVPCQNETRLQAVKSPPKKAA